jgi:hypothetical protein
MEQTVGVKIMHARNGREYRLPTLPRFSVDGYCPETNVAYEFFGCYHHGHDVSHSVTFSTREMILSPNDTNVPCGVWSR